MNYDPAAGELAQYPLSTTIKGQPYKYAYHFEPGEDDDGVTIEVPVSLAAAVPRETLDWLVPGLITEKIESLIKGLPKVYRKKLVPVSETVDIISREMPRGKQSLFSALGEFILQRFGVDIPAARIKVKGPDKHASSVNYRGLRMEADKSRNNRRCIHLILDCGIRTQFVEVDSSFQNWFAQGAVMAVNRRHVLGGKGVGNDSDFHATLHHLAGIGQHILIRYQIGVVDQNFFLSVLAEFRQLRGHALRNGLFFQFIINFAAGTRVELRCQSV